MLTLQTNVQSMLRRFKVVNLLLSISIEDVPFYKFITPSNTEIYNLIIIFWLQIKNTLSSIYVLQMSRFYTIQLYLITIVLKFPVLYQSAQNEQILNILVLMFVEKNKY